MSCRRLRQLERERERERERKCWGNLECTLRTSDPVRLALKAKIRKDFAFKIEIRKARRGKREGMWVDGLPLVVGDKGGGGTGLRLQIGGT
jgi:hypothetical protein